MGQAGGRGEEAPKGLEQEAGAKIGWRLKVKVRSPDRGDGVEKSSPLRDFLSLHPDAPTASQYSKCLVTFFETPLA